MTNTIYTFFQRVSIPPQVQQAYSRLPMDKLKTAGKVALVATLLLAIYSIYRSFQSLKNRVQQLSLAQQDTATKVNELRADNLDLKSRLAATESKVSAQEATISDLQKQLTSPSPRIDPLERELITTLNDESDDEFVEADSYSDLQKQFTSRSPEIDPFERILINTSKDESEDDFVDADLFEGEVPDHNTGIDEVSPPPSSATTMIDDRTNQIEKLKAQIPGKHIECNTKNRPMNLADFLMSTLLPVDQSESCSIDDEGNFTINFKEDKVFSFSKLPESMLKPLTWFEKRALNVFLRIAPSVQISKTIQGKIVTKDNHTDIELNSKAIFLMHNRMGFTAHLNVIRVYHTPNGKGRYVFIQGEHNSDKLPHKQGTIDHQIFVEVIELNLPQNLV